MRKDVCVAFPIYPVSSFNSRSAVVSGDSPSSIKPILTTLFYNDHTCRHFNAHRLTWGTVLLSQHNLGSILLLQNRNYSNRYRSAHFSAPEGNSYHQFHLYYEYSFLHFPRSVFCLRDLANRFLPALSISLLWLREAIWRGFLSRWWALREKT